MPGFPPDLGLVRQNYIDYLSAASELAALRARSPLPLQIVEEPSAVEDNTPCIIVYLTDITHRTDEDSGDFHVQDWLIGFALICCGAGETFRDSLGLTLSIASALMDAHLGGLGKSLGTNDGMIYDVVLRRGMWDATNSDAGLCVFAWSSEVSYRTG